MPNVHGAIVVGGGPAGAVAALALVRTGHEVTMFERDPEGKRIVCGSFVGPRAVVMLEAMGFPWAEAGAKPIVRLRISAGERSAEAELNFPAFCVPRPFLDIWLRRSAVAAGVRLNVAQVQGITWQPQQGCFEVLIADQQRFSTPALFIATGKHDLPRRPRREGTDGGQLVGLTMKFDRLTASVRAEVHKQLHMFFFRDGYGGISPSGIDGAIVSLVVHRNRLVAHGQAIEELLSTLVGEVPGLGQLLDSAHALDARPVVVAPLPYGWRCPVPAPNGPPCFPLGDQSAVLPSIAGVGISFALMTGLLAAHHYARSPHRGPRQHVLDARRLARRVCQRAGPLHKLIQRPRAAAMIVNVCRLMPGVLRYAAAGIGLPDQDEEFLFEQSQALRPG